MKVLVRGCTHGTEWTDAAGIDRYGCGNHADDRFPSRAKGNEDAKAAMT